MKQKDCDVNQNSGAATGGVLQKKLFLKIQQNSQEYICVGVSILTY